MPESPRIGAAGLRTCALTGQAEYGASIALEAVEVTRKAGNPGMSATAYYAAAQALWLTDPPTAWTMAEDSLALTRAGAFDSIHGFALSLASLATAC
jgi:hypothetical protein